MSMRLIRSSSLFPGAPYAYAAVTNQPGLVFTAGACPLDQHGQVTTPGDIPAQARQALANLRTALREAGAEIGDGVTVLGYLHQLVEIEAIAIAPVPEHPGRQATP